MAWTDATLNAQADDDAARAPYVSLHTADPGSTGTSEATGGSPAYSRELTAFDTAGVEGPLGASQPATVGVAWGEATFDLPAGTYTHYGYWSAATAGTFIGGFALPSSIVLSGQGVQSLSIAVGPEV